MKIEQFINKLPRKKKEFIEQFRKLIVEADNSVDESLGSIMAINNTINFTQQGVFKYGLSIAKHHISFHSMVLYANPILATALKRHLENVKNKKGCINFMVIDDCPTEVLRKHLLASAKIDFTNLINRYAKVSK